MTGKEIAMRLKEGDTEYQKFFRAALKKFGEKTPADMTDKEKKDFFNYIEYNWKGEDPETNEGCGKKHKKKMSEEDKLRASIRKEIAAALTGNTLDEEELVQEKNIYHFKNKIRGGMINVSLANDKAAQKYSDRLGSRWEMVNIGEAVQYLQELQELEERKKWKKK